MGKRASDDSGPTLGERVHIWLTSAKILYGLVIPLLAGMSAYGTSDAVRDTVHRFVNRGDLPVAGGEVVAPSEGQFEAQARQSLTSIVDKLSELEERIKNVESVSERDDSDLQLQLDALRAWHE